MQKVIFAHGLESSPGGTKALYLKEKFGAVAPELFTLGLNKQIDTLVQMLSIDGPCILVGSSMGGLAALGASVRCPEQISHLVLLAPAVGTSRNEAVFKDAEKTRPGLHLEVRDVEKLSIPAGVASTVIHGFEDDVVRANDVISLCNRSSHASLILVHDDHQLSNCRNLIVSVVGRAASGNHPLIP